MSAIRFWAGLSLPDGEIGLNVGSVPAAASVPPDGTAVSRRSMCRIKQFALIGIAVAVTVHVLKVRRIQAYILS